MLKNDYSMYRLLKKNGRYIQLVFVKKPYHSIDFCIWYDHFDGYINDIPETIFLKRVHSKSLYDDFKEIKFNNINIQLPKNHIILKTRPEIGDLRRVALINIEPELFLKLLLISCPSIKNDEREIITSINVVSD